MIPNSKGPEAHASGPFFLTCPTWLTYPIHQAYPAWLIYPTYRSVNVSSIVMSTGTGSPIRVPGANCHFRAARTAC